MEPKKRKPGRPKGSKNKPKLKKRGRPPGSVSAKVRPLKPGKRGRPAKGVAEKKLTLQLKTAQKQIEKLEQQLSLVLNNSVIKSLLSLEKPKKKAARTTVRNGAKRGRKPRVAKETAEA